MDQQRRRFPHALTLLGGLAIGWAYAGQRAPTLRAGGDRYGDYAVATGTVSVQYSDQSKIQSAQEAIYLLDYLGSRLMATIPTLRSTIGKSEIIDGFAERDLEVDFKLNPKADRHPHFIMTSGSLGLYGDGWAPLFVFETTTKQVAVYKVQSQAVGAMRATAKLELVQIKSWSPPALPALPTARP